MKFLVFFSFPLLVYTTTTLQSPNSNSPNPNPSLFKSSPHSFPNLINLPKKHGFPRPKPSTSAKGDKSGNKESTSAELLSFNEWRQKYVISEERRSKRTGQRSRQEAHVAGPSPVYDGDTSDVGSLFYKEDSNTNSQPEGTSLFPSTKEESIVTQLDKLSKPEQEPIQQQSQSPKPTASMPTSLIQPLPNVGFGDASDPLLMLKDRTNYAQYECAAMVHRSSKGSKGASQILVSKKDRYMLTPCSVKKKFVEIELCDEIRVDTVLVANYELFSSMFKHFSIRLSRDYRGREEDWVLLGNFRARNTRGPQVFRPPTTLPGFYRYMRIEFNSHYGSEYFCPVSLVKVFGLTQLDAFRWDEERAKADQYQYQDQELDEAESELEPRDTSLENESDKLGQIPVHPWAGSRDNATTSVTEEISAEEKQTSEVQKSAEESVSPNTSLEEILKMLTTVGTELQSSIATETSSTNAEPTSLSTSVSMSVSEKKLENSVTTSSVTLNSTVTELDTNTTSDQPILPSSPTESIDEIAPSTITVRVEGSSTRHLPPPVLQPVQSPQPGDSIYGIIMKRLGALEQNHSLTLHYLESQGSGLREAFERIDKWLEDLEALSMKHDQLLRQEIHALQKHSLKVAHDRMELSAQIAILTKELVFEKRLSFACLFGLLALFFFVGMTRGSNTSPFLDLMMVRRKSNIPLEQSKSWRLDPDQSNDSHRVRQRVVSLTYPSYSYPYPTRHSRSPRKTQKSHRNQRSFTPPPFEINLNTPPRLGFRSKSVDFPKRRRPSRPLSPLSANVNNNISDLDGYKRLEMEDGDTERSDIDESKVGASSLTGDEDEVVEEGAEDEEKDQVDQVDLMLTDAPNTPQFHPPQSWTRSLLGKRNLLRKPSALKQQIEVSRSASEGWLGRKQSA